MSYNILTLRTAEDLGGHFYPLLGDTNLVSFDEADGTAIQTFSATKLTVAQATQSGMRAIHQTPETTIAVFITASRLVVACDKFDKGGGWHGFDIASMATSAALNAASKARAAVRRRGKALVGHIRYPWLAAVGLAPRAGYGTVGSLRLKVLDRTTGADRDLFLTISLPKQADPAALAGQIARRAASHHLAIGMGRSEEERARYELLAAGEAIEPVKGKYTFYRMPRVRAVTPIKASRP